MMTSLEYDRALEEQASALTTCSICTDIFKYPKVLPCNHTFCLLCLQRHHDSTNSQRLVPVSSFSCPTCRKVCYVPRHSLDQLPNDFKVDQILDLVKAMSRSRASSLPSQKNTDVHGQGHGQGQVPLSECVVCRSARAVATPSEVFCVQCARSFCSACADHHARTPIFHGHTVVPAAGSVSAGWKCLLHGLEILYFCELCDAPACTICVLSIHERHSISDQGTVVANLRSHLAKSFERLKQRRDDFTSQLEEVSLLRQEHVRNLQDTERTVLRASREACRRIREEEEQALTDVRSCSKEKLERMDNTERQLSVRLESLAGLCRSHAEVLALTNAKTFFDSYTKLAADLGDGVEVGGAAGPEVEPALRDVSTFVARIQVRLGEVEKRVIDVRTLSRSPRNGLDGTRTLEAESKRTLTVMTGKDAEYQRLPDSSSRSSPSSELGQGQGQEQGEGQGKGQRRGRREEFLNPVKRKDFHISHSSISTASSANSTSSRDNRSRTNNSVGTGSSCGTNSSTNNNNATVNGSSKTSTSSTVGINLNSTNNGEGSTPRNNNTTPTKKSNHSTTYASNNFNNNNRHAVERSKSSPRSNGNHSTKPTSSTRSTDRTNGTPQLLWVSEEFSRCTDCAFTSNGQLVATDYAVATNRVKIFSSGDGRLVDTVDSCLIVQPWGLCYNESTSSILLTDQGNPSIKTVRLGSCSNSPEVRVYPSRSAKPSGIAVTRSGDLVVTDTGSRGGFKVGVYSIDQCRMTRTREFGCHGDGEGEILRPNFVAIDHCDRIVLSDSESHTVKVFSLTGQQLLKFSSDSEGKRMSPQGLVIDNANNILVSDQAVGGVVRYSPQGHLLDTVVQTSGLPFGISVSWESNLLAVATSRGLEVYRL